MALAEIVSCDEFVIEKSIRESSCWYDDVTGLEVEDLLRGEKAYTYILREGEKPHNYYVSFVETSGLIKHQPIVIKYFAEAWFCRNLTIIGPNTDETIVPIIHRIMHCEPSDPKPLNRKLS
ncbi:MAG: hypothetical protein JSR58_01255 [Verrucomicrobia bacterium]|nr:hypothetical protein [Verrucomicrobiota bacterium]